MFGAQVGLSEVVGAVATLESVMAVFEPGTLSGTDAASLLDTFAKGERICATGKALCAKRATDTALHRREGHSNPATWLAQRTGDSVGDAASALCTAEAASSLVHLDAALRAGELSADRARQVVQGASADPDAEASLVAAAKSSSMAALRERAAQAKASAGSAAGESAHLEAIRARRYLRHWSDAEGALRLDASLAPDDGARLVAELSAMATRLGKAARAGGHPERPGAIAADALVALVTGAGASGSGEGGGAGGGEASGGEGTGGGGGGGPSAKVSVRVDAGALRRGFVQGAECCEIPGVGPVPVATARSLLGDAWLRVVITDGVDIATVCHMGRTITAQLRSAIEERDQRCVVPGCEVDYGLEIDHWQVDVAADGPTCLSNLARLCHHHHLAKTHRGWRLAGGPGNWAWLAPPGPAPMGSPGPAPPPGHTGPAPPPSCRASPGAAGQQSLLDVPTDP
ncbi:MAG: HNH endonuclease signature motif containing protein [Acidimicrobiales bacterium]